MFVNIPEQKPMVQHVIHDHLSPIAVVSGNTLSNVGNVYNTLTYEQPGNDDLFGTVVLIDEILVAIDQALVTFV